VVQPSGANDYISLAGIPHLTTATLQALGPNATDEEQQAEAIKIALAYIKRLEVLTVDGVDYHILYYDSEIYHVHDRDKPIIVHQQLTEFQGKPRVTTLLQRPLKGSPIIPELLWRPADCHPDSFGDHGNCMVHMMHKCVTRRSQGRQPDRRDNLYVPRYTITEVEEEFDRCFTACNLVVGEYPYEAEQGWREGGATSDMAIMFCERQTQAGNPIACSIFHNGDKIYGYYPEGYTNQVIFSIHEHHCYFYTQSKRAATDARLWKMKDPAFDCLRVGEVHKTERGKPWAEWQCYLSLGIEDDFRPFKLKRKRDAKEGPYYTKDNNLQEIWESLGNVEKQRTFGADPEVIASIRIQLGEHTIVIRAVPLMADTLDTIAKLAGFVYKGSSIAKFGDDLRVACMRLRPEIPPHDKAMVKARQGYMCAMCEDPAIRDIDHITPRARGGRDTLDNYQALCGACHALKTQRECDRFETAWHSCLSRDTIEAVLAAHPCAKLCSGTGRSPQN